MENTEKSILKLNTHRGLAQSEKSLYVNTHVMYIWTVLYNLQQPFRCEIEHKLGVSCVNSGPVVCRVALDRGGYVPGETIGISATVQNKSRVTIKATKASLTEVTSIDITE
jgi:Arrestin (or S-antigen), C-terminal domain.